MLLMALLGAGCAATGRCLSERECASTAPLPPCAGGQAMPWWWEDILAHGGAQLGRTVSVRGPLHHSAQSCTQARCPQGRCCNGCDAHLVLAAVNDAPDARALRLSSSDGAGSQASLRCRGDDSRVCCPLSLGQDVVATGKVVKLGEGLEGPVFALQDPALCAMPVR